MEHLYMQPGSDYCNSPMSFASVPDLVPCRFDDVSTDPSPSPPMVRLYRPFRLVKSQILINVIPQMAAHFDNRFTSYPSSLTVPQYMETPPQIINSIEFTDLTRPQTEDRRRRKSNTMQDKENVTNMRIVSASMRESFAQAYD